MGCIFINKWQENVNGFNAGLMILQQFFEIPETVFRTVRGAIPPVELRDRQATTTTQKP